MNWEQWHELFNETHKVTDSPSRWYLYAYANGAKMRPIHDEFIGPTETFPDRIKAAWAMGLADGEADRET